MFATPPASFQSSRKIETRLIDGQINLYEGRDVKPDVDFYHVSTVKKNAFISLEIDELTGTRAVPLIRLEQLRWQGVIKMRLVTLFTRVRSV